MGLILVQADEEVACFKCDYISESSDDQHCLNPRKDATPTASCQVCQVGHGGAIWSIRTELTRSEILAYIKQGSGPYYFNVNFEMGLDYFQSW